jgi:proteasome assembly chaperone (PAC2) family protein
MMETITGILHAAGLLVTLAFVTGVVAASVVVGLRFGWLVAARMLGNPTININHYWRDSENN